MKPIAIMAALAVSALSISRTVAVPSDPYLIVPGQSIGKFALGPHGTQVLKRVGKPTLIDAGMNQTRQVWLTMGRIPATVFIHTVNNSVIGAKPTAGITIDTIRITSSKFHIRNGISTGATLAEVRRRFPNVRLERDQKSAVIYSDSTRGIAFDFQLPGKNEPLGRCQGIQVFSPNGGGPVSPDTISLL